MAHDRAAGPTVQGAIGDPLLLTMRQRARGHRARPVDQTGAVRRTLGTYTTFGIGCAVVWAVVLSVVATSASKHTLHVFLLIFFGFAIGWVSATIARVVYPPPKSPLR